MECTKNCCATYELFSTVMTLAEKIVFKKKLQLPDRKDIVCTDLRLFETHIQAGHEIKVKKLLALFLTKKIHRATRNALHDTTKNEAHRLAWHSCLATSTAYLKRAKLNFKNNAIVDNAGLPAITSQKAYQNRYYIYELLTHTAHTKPQKKQLGTNKQTKIRVEKR